jgi:hypothetical protein
MFYAGRAILVMENFKIKNKFVFEAGGKREAGGDDKLTFFLMGPSRSLNIIHIFVGVASIFWNQKHFILI